MKVLVLSTPEMAVEFKAKFSQPFFGQAPLFITSYNDMAICVEGVDIVFDFLLAGNREKLVFYTTTQKLVVFCHAVTIQLAELLRNYTGSCTFIGFNGMPSLFNRPVLEVTLLHKNDAAVLKNVCQKLLTPFILTEDRVGMATPRILCMIINEAFYSLQEKIASEQDVDLAMKLGTNYPAGPFEWGSRIGLENVYQVLQAVYSDTKDERYKICPLLKTMVLKKTSVAM
ncbi:3-hydroxyacyl-CoA dehydrogenase family protein [Pontibacter sp. 13R65]|uniref:3-hydroxyacyl-CoA dehydrogenase family protein n=1 Tax=Pontibacter sp. 13R65 TaxID=3127458 RepID=UPI00301D4161